MLPTTVVSIQHWVLTMGIQLKQSSSKMLKLLRVYKVYSTCQRSVTLFGTVELSCESHDRARNEQRIHAERYIDKLSQLASIILKAER